MQGKANIGRPSLPRRANQCQVAGLTSPLGSQNDVAAPLFERAAPEPAFQDLVVAHVGDTARRALFLVEHEAPAYRNDLAVAVGVLAHDRPGKIDDSGSNATARFCDTRKKRITSSRFLLRE